MLGQELANIGVIIIFLSFDHLAYLQGGGATPARTLDLLAKALKSACILNASKGLKSPSREQ